MVHIWHVSGEELTEVSGDEVTDVAALKLELQSLCGASPFRQRLVGNGSSLDNDASLLHVEDTW